MGSLRRKTTTRSLPADAVIVTKARKQVAQWIGRNGKPQTAPVRFTADGTPRLLIESKPWFGKYRDADGRIIERATGCKDKQAAATVLQQWESEAEKIRRGIWTRQEVATADHMTTPIDEHLDAFMASLESKGTTERHRQEVANLASKVFSEIGFKSLQDVDAESVERWLNSKRADGMGARRRNIHLQSVKQFSKWAFETGRISTMPLQRLKMANQKADQRQKRRAFTEQELNRLLFAARWRPLAEAGRVTVADDPQAGKRAGWHYEELRFENINEAVERARLRLAKNPKLMAELDRTGRERELIYRTMAQTGLRRGELASVTHQQVRLDVEPPRLCLTAGQTKNRQEVQIILRSDLAADLGNWIKDSTGESKKLFRVPDRHSLIKIFDRDLELAGLEKIDERGQTVCIHSLRHTFATLLAKSGVTPKDAQTLLRHSDVNLTLSVYSHSSMSDLVSSLDALPTLGSNESFDQFQTGGRKLAPLLAPLLAPNLGPMGPKLAISDQSDDTNDLPNNLTTQTKNPENIGECATFSGSLETSKGGTRTRDTRLMKPVL